MAIEDEIINIAELDVGTELLNTDKLLIETNNGTRLLDFKDFVIGPDNISGVREDQIEYPQVGEAAANSTSSVWESITGFNVLTTDTSPGVRTAYKDLSGGIELSKFNYNAIANIASLTANWEDAASQLASVKQDIIDVGNTTGVTVLSAVNFRVFANDNLFPIKTGTNMNHIQFNDTNRNPETTHTDGSLKFRFKAGSFYITYPDESNWSKSWILFTGKILASNQTAGFSTSFNVSVRRNGTDEITTGIPLVKNGKFKSLLINHVELIDPGDTIRIVANDYQKIKADSFFSGFRITAG